MFEYKAHEAKEAEVEIIVENDDVQKFKRLKKRHRKKLASVNFTYCIYEQISFFEDNTSSSE